MSHVSAFMLDEYVGLDESHPNSYRAEILRQFAAPQGVSSRQVHTPSADDPEATDAALRAIGGVGLQILGIGSNGHVAFNEPGSDADSVTRVVDLHESTRTANSRFFARLSDVPRQAVTQGIATVMGARSVVLAATGAGKAEAVHAMLFGDIGPATPASFLRNHPDVTVIVDATLWTVVQRISHTNSG